MGKTIGAFLTPLVAAGMAVPGGTAFCFLQSNDEAPAPAAGTGPGPTWRP
jgi:hypothetical protein